MISNINIVVYILIYFLLYNIFKALMICFSFSQYISDIIMVLDCMLDIVNKIL